MQIIENDNVKEKVYIEKFPNGITVMCIPKKDIRKKYAIWGINYGSIDNKFIVPGEEQVTEVPKGIAHFLEHKMFEQESGTNSLDTLTALGVDANAYTTNDHTSYLFECTDNFYEALDELMDYVQHPYFTDENVEKEKGIIGQEIMMYDDYPEWKVYMNTVESLYKQNPVRLDITGTKDTISEITKETLYKCYNTFYHPSNTVFCVCGDFNPEEIIKEIEGRLIKKDNHGQIKRLYEEEPEEINKKEAVQKMEVSKPIFIVAYKDTVPDKDIVKKHVAIEILLNLIIGKSSKLYQELYQEELLNTEPELDYEFSKTYAHIMISGRSNDPRKVYEKIKDTAREYMQNGINEDDFERCKKKIYGQYIKEYNEVSDTARMFVADYFKGINSFDYVEECMLISKEYASQVLKEVFMEEKSVISIIEGKE